MRVFYMKERYGVYPLPLPQPQPRSPSQGGVCVVQESGQAGCARQIGTSMEKTFLWMKGSGTFLQIQRQRPSEN